MSEAITMSEGIPVGVVALPSGPDAELIRVCQQFAEKELAA